MKRAGSEDIKKLTELIKNKFSVLSRVAFSGKYSDLSEKATAKDVGALPVTGGTVSCNTLPTVILKRNDDNYAAGILFRNNSGDLMLLQCGFAGASPETEANFLLTEKKSNTLLLNLSKEERKIYDSKSGELKKILVEGDIFTPTVKETAFVTNNGDLKVEGRKGNSYTDITDIFIKANSYREGMIIGISSNGMGYIVAQNFNIDCSKITDDERVIIQSQDAIKFIKANDSSDFPTLKPGASNFEVGFMVRGKNGYINSTTKMEIGSNSSQNYFQYNLPNEFKNDDNSQNNLLFGTKEWITFTGINTKSY